MKTPLCYILFFKPYGVLSQFTSDGKWKSLKDFGPFPSRVYSVGRLDVDSEGLLLLTNDNVVKHKLVDPKYRHPRTYLAQIEEQLDEEDVRRLQTGVVLDGVRTRPAEVRTLDKEPKLPPRLVPIRCRKNISTSWIELTLREGRNHQVRRMTAAVRHPTLRLVRTKIDILSLEGLVPGEIRHLTKPELLRLRSSLGIDKSTP